jgi:hypothetical protein
VTAAVGHHQVGIEFSFVYVKEDILLSYILSYGGLCGELLRATVLNNYTALLVF